MRVIITTVGTSLLTNYLKENNEKPTAQSLANYLRQTAAEQASAETNSLRGLLKDGDGVVFLHSSTREGALCADSLSRHFNGMGYNSRYRHIPDLSYQEARFRMRGLRSLVSTIIELIKEERDRGNDVGINATGGFKAEIAYATLIGLLFDIPVYYMHEQFQEIIEMPPVPIAWDCGLFLDYDDLIEWLNQDLRTADEAAPRLKGIPPDLRFLVTEEDGFVLLSPVGEIFYEACRAREAVSADVPILLSSRAKATLDAVSIDERAVLIKYLKKMRDPLIRRSRTRQKNNSDCLVFLSGRIPERIFYYENDEGIVHVCDLAPNHDQYERMLDRGVWRKHFDGFAEM